MEKGKIARFGRVTALVLILSSAYMTPLPAQGDPAEAAEAYVSPWSLGLSFGLGLSSSFSALGSIMVIPQVRLTNEFRFGPEAHPKDAAMTLDLSVDMAAGFLAEMGVEWERKDGAELKSPFGLYGGAGFGADGIILRAGCRWKPFEASRSARNGETLTASILSPGLAASYALGSSLSTGSISSGITASLDLLAGSLGLNVGQALTNVNNSAAADAPPPPLAFIVETGIHSLPLMYWAIVPTPFTEWSFGLEFGAKDSSSALIFRMNAAMLFFDFHECLALEYVFFRLRNGNWRPGFSLEIILSYLLAYLPSNLGVPWLSTISVGLDLLCWDFEPNNGPPIRLSFVPLYSHYLDLSRPHVLTLMRLGWMF